MNTDDFPVVIQITGYPTGLRINQNCDDNWKVPTDRGSKTFEEWVQEDQKKREKIPTAMKDFELMEDAWRESRRTHCATLRRIGWIDQKGRVWTDIPPSSMFDGGSLTPLLIDVRES